MASYRCSTKEQLNANGSYSAHRIKNLPAALAVGRKELLPPESTGPLWYSAQLTAECLWHSHVI